MATIATNISIPNRSNTPSRLGPALANVDNQPMAISPPTQLATAGGLSDVLPNEQAVTVPSVFARRAKASLAVFGKYLVVRVLPGMLTIATILVLAAMLEVGNYEVLGVALLFAAAVKSLSYQGLRALLQTHLDWRDEGLVFALTPCLVAGASLFFIASDTAAGQLLWLFTGMAVLLAQSIQELHLEYHHPRMWLRRRAGVMLARTLVSAAAGFWMVGMNAPLPLVGTAMMLVWLLPSVWALLKGDFSPAVNDEVFDLPASASMTPTLAAAGKAL